MDPLHRYLHSVLAESEHSFKVFNSAGIHRGTYYCILLSLSDVTGSQTLSSQRKISSLFFQ